MDLIVQIIVAVLMVLVIALTANVLVLMSTKEVIAPIVRKFSFASLRSFLAANHMFKVNNKNTRTRCEIYSKLAIKTPEQRVSLLLTC